VTKVSYRFVVELFTETRIVSVAATAESVTVKLAGVAEPAAVKRVMAPVRVFSVTPVVRLVSWVTAPPAPAPVAYPRPRVGELSSTPSERSPPVKAMVPVPGPERR